MKPPRARAWSSASREERRDPSFDMLTPQAGGATGGADGDGRGIGHRNERRHNLDAPLGGAHDATRRGRERHEDGLFSQSRNSKKYRERALSQTSLHSYGAELTLTILDKPLNNLRLCFRLRL